MSDSLSEADIVRALARKVASRVARRTISDLRKMQNALLDKYPELETAWDEICVQVRYERSFLWGSYEETVRSLVDHYVGELQKYERDAIWLQTDAAMIWECEDSESPQSYPVRDGDIVNYIVHEYIFLTARAWSNARIRAFINRINSTD
jgi:hypothetical protein